MKFFLHSAGPFRAALFEKISNNVDFSLWGNHATTLEYFLTFSSETKIMKIRHSAYPRLDCNNTGCSERVQRCMYTNITLWIRSVIVICDFDGGSGICIEKIRHTFPLRQAFIEHLLVKWMTCHYLVLKHWELAGYRKKNFLFTNYSFI